MLVYIAVMLVSLVRTRLKLKHIFCVVASCIGVLGYDNGAIGAAVITVIIIHAIIFMYIRVAITEDQPVKKRE